MNPIQVKIKLTHPNAKLPTKGSKHAGAWDVYAAEILSHNNTHIVDLGFSLEFSNNFRVMLQPRSSIVNTYLIQQNSPGLGDSDFRGSYRFIFKMLPHSLHGTNYNSLSYKPFPYKVGDRVGQMYLEEIIPISFEQVDELSDTERGEGGFGSTGK